jgi:hypothetical protein
MTTAANNQLVITVESGQQFKIFGHENHVYPFLLSEEHIPTSQPFLWTTALYYFQRQIFRADFKTTA